MKEIKDYFIYKYILNEVKYSDIKNFYDKEIKTNTIINLFLFTFLILIICIFNFSPILLIIIASILLIMLIGIVSIVRSLYQRYLKIKDIEKIINNKNIEIVMTENKRENEPNTLFELNTNYSYLDYMFQNINKKIDLEDIKYTYNYFKSKNIDLNMARETFKFILSRNEKNETNEKINIEVKDMLYLIDLINEKLENKNKEDRVNGILDNSFN